MAIRGYDISAMQGILSRAHWRAMAADAELRFVSLRCGYGNEAPDSRYLLNLANARETGRPVQAYHVGFPLRPDPAHPRREPEAQADRHLEESLHLGSGAGELRPALDLEWPPPELWPKYGIDRRFVRTWSVAYGRRLGAGIGRRPLLYGYPAYLHELASGLEPGELAELAEVFDLWAAEYGVSTPYVIPPWTGCVFWQRSGGGGRLPNGATVDEDVFEGTEDAFRAECNLPVDVTHGGEDKPVHPAIDPKAT